MKTLFYILIFCMCSSASYAQEWMPMVVNTVEYVPYNYSVTNYYTEWRPVNIPVIRYYNVQPHQVFFVKPKEYLYSWYRPYYYVYPNIYQYVPARY